MEEMLDDTLEGLDEDEELEEEADEEVEKVLFELTDGKLGQAGKVGGELPVRGLLGLPKLAVSNISLRWNSLPKMPRKRMNKIARWSVCASNYKLISAAEVHLPHTNIYAVAPIYCTGWLDV
jgi:hypothetical protein